MTRKDYVMIAAVIKERTEAAEQAQRMEALSELVQLSHKLSNALSADNPRFEAARFLTACGV